jgi:hypothetical protein
MCPFSFASIRPPPFYPFLAFLSFPPGSARVFFSFFPTVEARKTYRGVISLPKIIAEPPAQISQQTPEAVEGEMEVDG